MFGMSFGELLTIGVVAIIVIGPKDMPKVLRMIGQWAAKLRRMASDLRAQSGIDDAIRAEGLTEGISEIRKLARGELEGVTKAMSTAKSEIADLAGTPLAGPAPELLTALDLSEAKHREYPREGPDSYGAEPETAELYHPLTPSDWSRDPLYMLGDPEGILPPVPPGPNADEAPRTPFAQTESLADSGHSSASEGHLIAGSSSNESEAT